MKDTNKLVLGVTVAFIVMSGVAVLQGGSLIVSSACTLTAVALALAFKYKCERSNTVDIVKFLQKSITAKNLRIASLEDVITCKILETNAKEDLPKEESPVEVAKKLRRYKSKPKTEVLV